MVSQLERLETTDDYGRVKPDTILFLNLFRSLANMEYQNRIESQRFGVQQAKELGIDPSRVVAAGFSAGGHLASSTAILDEFTISKFLETFWFFNESQSNTDLTNALLALIPAQLA